MASLTFCYGTMNASKSAQLLMVAHNYEELGKKVMIFTPAIDTRSPENVVESRIGISHEAISVKDDTDISDIVSKAVNDGQEIACVLVDEAQFLTRSQVIQLTFIVDFLNIPVMAYGLRTDFRVDLFEGSKYLMAWADSIKEIKTVCHCGRKATINARYVDGELATTGQQIEIGGNEMYMQLCRKHFIEEYYKAKGIDLPDFKTH